MLSLQEICRVEIRRVLRRTAERQHPDILIHTKVIKVKKSRRNRDGTRRGGGSPRVNVNPLGMMLGEQARAYGGVT